MTSRHTTDPEEIAVPEGDQEKAPLLPMEERFKDLPPLPPKEPRGICQGGGYCGKHCGTCSLGR